MGEQRVDLYVVVGDAGSCLDLIEPVGILQKGGASVRWFVDAGSQARAGQILERNGIPYEAREYP